MMNDQTEKYILRLLDASPSSEVLWNIGDVLAAQATDSISHFVSHSFGHLSILETWAWTELSRIDRSWTDDPLRVEFFKALALFNMNVILNAKQIQTDVKASLLLPREETLIDDVIDQLEILNDDEHPAWTIIGDWFNTLNHLVQENIELIALSSIRRINENLEKLFLKSNQYKAYLEQLHECSSVEAVFSPKFKFYIRTCSFSLSVYLCPKTKFYSRSVDEILFFLAKDYYQIVMAHSYEIESWGRDFTACFGSLIQLVAACCWYVDETGTTVKLITPNEKTSYNHVEALIRIVSYAPFHGHTDANWCNEETILIDGIMNLLINILQAENVICFVRYNTSLNDALTSIAETSVNERIIICVYGILAQILSDDQLKELKIVNNMCQSFFNTLERAWKHPWQIYRQIPIIYLLKGYLSLANNDYIQQKTAELNKVPFLMELCSRYPITYEIIWALSFNQSIRDQLNCNDSFVEQIMHLQETCVDDKMRKIYDGIVWNMNWVHGQQLASNQEEKIIFDIMISYSHSDREFCQQIYDELKRKKFRIWIDFDQMHGNIMDAMAHAIDHSKVVLVCMSESYRRSNYCRAEAQYAFQRQVRLVPILTQKYYKPDGWLAFLTGHIFYINFTKYDFSEAMEMLIKEINLPNACHTERNNTDKNNQVCNRTDSSETSVLSSPKSTYVNNSDNPLDWSNERVSEWLNEHNLINMRNLFHDFDGRMLINLNEMLKSIDSKQTLNSLVTDCIRKTGQPLSLIELARLRALLDEQQKKSLSILRKDAQVAKSNVNQKKHVRLIDYGWQATALNLYASIWRKTLNNRSYRQ